MVAATSAGSIAIAYQRTVADPLLASMHWTAQIALDGRVAYRGSPNAPPSACSPTRSE